MTRFHADGNLPSHQRSISAPGPGYRADN